MRGTRLPSDDAKVNITDRQGIVLPGVSDRLFVRVCVCARVTECAKECPLCPIPIFSGYDGVMLSNLDEQKEAVTLNN